MGLAGKVGCPKSWWCVDPTLDSEVHSSDTVCTAFAYCSLHRMLRSTESSCLAVPHLPSCPGRRARSTATASRLQAAASLCIRALLLRVGQTGDPIKWRTVHRDPFSVLSSAWSTDPLVIEP